MAQYWEDQRNIDSLLGHVEEQHSTDEPSVPGTVPGDGQQGPVGSELESGQQPVLQQSPKVTDANRERSAADVTEVNPLSGLVNYESSDAESETY